MAKYYVISGLCREVIAGPHIENEEDAACESVYKAHKKLGELILEYFSPYIIVSEKGFDVFEHDITDDVIYSTFDILKKSGLIQKDIN